MNAAAAFWAGVLLLAIGVYGGYTFYKVASRESNDSQWIAAAETDDAPKLHIDESPPKRSDDETDDSEIQGNPGDFTLTTQTGALFQSKSLKDKVWVGSIFFSLCPRECKLQNQAIAQLRKQLADADLTWVSITCDPQMDTPAVLAEYAKRFDADPRTWKFLTGKEQRIRRVAVDYFKVPFGRQTHSKHLVLIGRDGEVAGRYDVFNAEQVARFKKKVGELITDSDDSGESAPVVEAARSEAGRAPPNIDTEKELDRVAP